jgi:alcohol dehydrogenase
VACASTAAKLDRLHALGADHLINYAERDFVQEILELYGKPSRRGANIGNGLDVVVNFTGGDTWVKSLRCLKVGGRLLTCGATAGYDPKEDLRFIWTFELEIRGSNGWQRSDIEALLEMVRLGKLNTLVERTYSLADAAEALRVIEDRDVFGKIVVTP